MRTFWRSQSKASDSPSSWPMRRGRELELQASQHTSLSSQCLQVPGIGMSVTKALHSGSKPLFAGRANQQPLRTQERRRSLPPPPSPCSTWPSSQQLQLTAQVPTASPGLTLALQLCPDAIFLLWHRHPTRLLFDWAGCITSIFLGSA